MPLEARSELVIGQWVDSPKLRSAIDAPVGALEEDVLPAFDAVQLMHEIDAAEGVWLDYLGGRVGLRRPYTTDPAQDERFGFDEAGVGFDNAPFRGDAANDAVYSLSDSLFRRLVKARAQLVLGDGTFQTFAKAVMIIDDTAQLRDLRDMTVRISTSNRRLLELADSAGALPRNAGVRIRYVERGKFGFDEAGVGFDQGPFAREDQGA